MNTSQIDSYTLKHYTRAVIAFFGCLVALSIFQYSLLYAKGIVDIIFGRSFFIALVHHIGFSSLTGIFLVFPFKFLENLRPRYGMYFALGSLGVLLLIELFLTVYFCTVLLPLGSDIAAYSWEEVRFKAFNANSWGTLGYFLLGALLLQLLFLGMYRSTVRFYRLINGMFPLTLVFFSIFITAMFTPSKPINQNKTYYLGLNLYRTATEEHSYDGKSTYPLLRPIQTQNTLKPYFNLKKTKPNLVFFIVEGLGRDFVGKDAPYGGFTPFLDSLSTQSLYWKNCLSTTGRNFGALPALVGSLPFGKNGFMGMEEYPNKLTLYGILKKNAYHTSYYQGSNGAFDNVVRFLQSEDVDLILDKAGFGKNYDLQTGDSGGYSWGYPDLELFRKSVSLDRSKDTPRMEVYLTLSTRDPFLPPKMTYYTEQVEKTLERRAYGKRERRIIKKNNGVFASLLYADNALAWFFEAYKKLPGYENTIFIVTGNHLLPAIPARNEISRFHVPLLIYSPLLKAPRKMEALNSHFDIAPSIVSLLHKQYNLSVPEKTAWLGSGLDTEKTFRSAKRIPLMRNKNELKDYVKGTTFLSDGEVFEMDKNLGLTPLETEDDTLELALNRFKGVNQYITKNNRIIPDSLAVFNFEKEKFSGRDIVWIHSVFNGHNFDRAFDSARELALAKEYDRALLLLRYIVSEVPGNVDAKILMGRINGWRGHYSDSITLLQEAIEMVPDYIDAYAALFDVYYWSGRYKEGYELIAKVQQNSSRADEIYEKIARAKKLYDKENQLAIAQ